MPRTVDCHQVDLALTDLGRWSRWQVTMVLTINIIKYSTSSWQMLSIVFVGKSLESLQSRCTLQWRHNEHDGVSNHLRLNALLNRLFRRRSKKTSKLRATGLCEGNSPVTGEFSSHRASNAENVSIWWRHHGGDVFQNLMWWSWQVRSSEQAQF